MKNPTSNNIFKSRRGDYLDSHDRVHTFELESISGVYIRTPLRLMSIVTRFGWWAQLVGQGFFVSHRP